MEASTTADLAYTVYAELQLQSSSHPLIFASYVVKIQVSVTTSNTKEHLQFGIGKVISDRPSKSIKGKKMDVSTQTKTTSLTKHVTDIL